MNSLPYPIDAIPRNLQDLVIEFQQNSNVPIELAAPMVIAVASVVCQGLVDVARPNCDPSPCSLFSLVIAGSGERKSTVLNKLMAPIRDFEATLAARVAVDSSDYEAKFLTWDVQQKFLLQEIKRSTKKNESVDVLKDRLALHIAQKPSEPQRPKFVYEDPTPEAVIEGVCSTWHSIAVVSSEAGGLINGRTMSDLSMWNKVWDGAGIGSERIGRGSNSNRNARGSVLLAVQEGPFKTFCDTRGAQAMDIGFLARFLIARPPSTIGTRLLTQDVYGRQPTWKALTAFHTRVRELLESQVEKQLAGSVGRTLLKFSWDAERRWIDAYNKIEEMQGCGGYLSTVPGYASKIGENAARIAAIFHCFGGLKGSISIETIESALMIARWHTQEFLQIFGPASQIPIEQRDAQEIEQWLFNSVWCCNFSEIMKNRIRQYGPSSIRNKIRLDNALYFLLDEDKIFIDKRGEGQFVKLNPNFFQSTYFQKKSK